MNRVLKLRQDHNEKLEKFCKENDTAFTSILKLLDAEKTKKLLRRNALLQQNIDKEIENAIENENR